MSERRWKVKKIENRDDHIFYRTGDILTLYDVGKFDDCPEMMDKKGNKYHCYTDRIVEIDADGNTIRTYKEGDTLDGGTVVAPINKGAIPVKSPYKREEKSVTEITNDMLDEYINKSERLFGGHIVKRISELLKESRAEVQRLRDKLATVHDVWEGAPEWANRAVVSFSDPDCKKGSQSHVYRRELPKTIEQEIAEKYSCDTELCNPMINGKRAVDVIKEALEEYKERTK